LTDLPERSPFLGIRHNDGISDGGRPYDRDAHYALKRALSPRTNSYYRQGTGSLITPTVLCEFVFKRPKNAKFVLSQLEKRLKFGNY
jgi:hypothetical protein